MTAAIAKGEPHPATLEAARSGARRELKYHLFRYRRTWRGTVVISIVNPLLFLLAIGLGLGRLVGDHGATLHGTPYLAFFAPGMLAAAAMQNGIVESAFPVSRATAVHSGESGHLFRLIPDTVPVQSGQVRG